METIGGVPTSVVHIEFDTVTPTPVIPTPFTSTFPMASIQTAPPPNSGLPDATKIGLGMIPVVVFAVGLYMLSLSLYRKRRAACEQAQRPPPVPKKEIRSYNSSLTSHRRGSKVLNMSAFSTPIHDERQFGSLYAVQIAPIPEQSLDTIVEQSDRVAVPKKSAHSEPSPDSPIDGSSPFRLKRGDTIKRYSLGPELAQLWPSPPATAWLGPLNEDHDLPALTYGVPARHPYRDATVYRRQDDGSQLHRIQQQLCQI
jgi:hypothetical protein